jgi:hypothetical protein
MNEGKVQEFKVEEDMKTTDEDMKIMIDDVTTEIEDGKGKEAHRLFAKILAH